MDNGVDRAIKAAGGGLEGAKVIAELLSVGRSSPMSPQAIYRFRRKGWFPTDHARKVADRFNIPLADLVREDIRAALLNA